MDTIISIRNFYEVLRILIDILAIAFLIYQVYKILLNTKAMQLIKGTITIGIIYAIAYFFRLETLLWLMNKLGTVFIIIIVIVFQPEIRSLFTRVGQSKFFKLSATSKLGELESILNAAEILATMKRGCLIVFVQHVGLKNIIESGTKLNADISSNLLLTIFGTDTQLHDGAVIINGSRVVAAGCVLPLTEHVDIKRSFGTRHRAAIGISETSDAVALIVSEEKSSISIAYDGILYYDLEKDELKKSLKKILNIKDDLEKKEGVEVEN